MHTRPTLADLRRRYLDGAEPLPRKLQQELRDDPRAGVQALLEAILARRRANRSESRRLDVMLTYERAWWARGMRVVAGVDEAGMSPLAGPVVAAAVILPEGLPPARRRRLQAARRGHARPPRAPHPAARDRLGRGHRQPHRD